VSAPASEQEYTRQDALRATGISERRLRSWERAGLIAPSAKYGFQELIALRTLARLVEAKLSPRKIKRAVDAVRRKLDGISNPLTELKIYSDGKRIRVRAGKERMDPESGQLLLDFDEDELERMVRMPARAAKDAEEARLRKEREAETWFLRGVEMEQSGAPVDQVLDAYKLAVALDPGLAAAQVNLGTIYFGAGDYSRAEKFYTRALEANPKYPLAHFNMANLCDQRGDKELAFTHYLMALRLEPGYADAHYNLALLYQNNGETMKAVRHWRLYLKLDPSSSWADVARRELAKLIDATLIRRRG
jgi:tetratricopeptide (TPR) repeat protein